MFLSQKLLEDFLLTSIFYNVSTKNADIPDLPAHVRKSSFMVFFCEILSLGKKDFSDGMVTFITFLWSDFFFFFNLLFLGLLPC